MREIRRHAELGHFENQWLNARHHFSFGHYHDPARMGFGPLRVINDDIVAPGAGFDPHPHREMEIITYVRRGAITHTDNQGNVGRTGAGEVQVMSAGTGIVHAEHNREAEETTLFQIWIEPNTARLPPRWEARAFPAETVAAGGTLPLLVSGLPQHAEIGALWIGADAAIYGGRLPQGAELVQPYGGRAYVLVSEGEVRVDEATLKRGDALIIEETGPLTLQAMTDAEMLLIDLPK